MSAEDAYARLYREACSHAASLTRQIEILKAALMVIGDDECR